MQPQTSTNPNETVTWATAGEKTIILRMDNNGCMASLTKEITIFEPLNTPSVTCTEQTQNSITFGWDEIAGATSYHIEISMNGVFEKEIDLPFGINKHIETNLQADDDVRISITAIGSEPCGDSETIAIDCQPISCPVADFILPAQACVGEDISLDFTGVATQNATFDWDFSLPDIFENISATENYLLSWNTAGTRTIELTLTENECTQTQEYSIEIVDLTLDAPNAITLTEGQSTPLNINAISTQNNADLTYNWSPSTGLSCTDCANPIASPSENTTYTVTVSDDAGCSETAAIIVGLQPAFEADTKVMPTAFSPNNDGLNDLFKVVAPRLAGLEIHIFNRWGTEVFVSQDLTNSWDGTVNGEPAALGVYTYWASLTYDDGDTDFIKGSVLLIR